MTHVILINGKKRSGKDFFAEKLQEELYKNKKTSEVMSFADPIKEIISTTFNITKEQLDDYKNDKNKIAVVKSNDLTVDYSVMTDFRTVLQNFGTEAMQTTFGQDVWVDLLRNKAKESDVDFVIVPDFRFLQEYISPLTVKIRNDEIDNACADKHASENELNDFEFMFEIDNSGQPDLTDQIQKFVKDILN